MSKLEFLMPQMGESITEATIISWSKDLGDIIEEDETLLEIATDKVDSELPSPYAGKVIEILHKEGEVVAVGSVIAIIEVEAGAYTTGAKAIVKHEVADVKVPSGAIAASKLNESVPTSIESDTKSNATAQIHELNHKQGTADREKDMRPSQTNRFYSPLVRTIAEIEKLSVAELDTITGSGAEGRVTKGDVAAYVRLRSSIINKQQINYNRESEDKAKSVGASYSGDVEIIEMDRMRRLISDHMVRSKQTSPHVTSFLEIDVTDIVEWREKNKEQYFSDYGEKITYTPIFIHAVANAIKDFPAINASVEGYNIILKKSINIGMATATASGNLIVPVIKDADHFDLSGLVASVNDLAVRARTGKLKPDEVQGGTFTLTNVGTFGNTMGTPIINQPQAAILSVGAIRKRPGVVEAPEGDRIDIRRYMFLSLSYDHRIVDGSLGGSFLRRVGDYLEGFKGI